MLCVSGLCTDKTTTCNERKKEAIFIVADNFIPNSYDCWYELIWNFSILINERAVGTERDEGLLGSTLQAMYVIYTKFKITRAVWIKTARSPVSSSRISA